MLVKEDEQMPALFSDPVVRRSSHWVLSTSAIYTKNCGSYGWGEVVPDGFSVAYVAGFDFFYSTVLSRAEMPNNEFCESSSARPRTSTTCSRARPRAARRRR